MEEKEPVLQGRLFKVIAFSEIPAPTFGNLHQRQIPFAVKELETHRRKKGTRERLAETFETSDLEKGRKWGKGQCRQRATQF